MKLLAAALAALAFPASASAALEVKLSLASTAPKKGAWTAVQLRPFWTYNRADGSCCRLRPADVRYPFRVEAVSPKGPVTRIIMRRTSNRFVWSSRIRFPAVGRWTLRAPQWGPRYSRHYGARPRITFIVSR